MRRATYLLGLGIACLALASCGPKTAEKVTLTLNFPLSGSDNFISALATKFPDVNFEVTWYRGRNPGTYVLQQLEHDDSSDLVFSPYIPNAELQKASLLDLSSSVYPTRYDTLTWKDYSLDGHIYCLPGPVVTQFLAYNKTMFDQKGWPLPHSLSDLLALAPIIRQDPDGITPLSLSGANVMADQAFFEALVQNEAVYKENGSDWETSFLDGSASCSAGVAGTSSMLKQLVNAHAFSAADELRWRGECYERFFTKRSAAMLYVFNGQEDLDALINKSSDTFGAIALPGYHHGNGLLGLDSLVSFGIAKRLGNKGNEAKKAKALSVIDYLSSEEGMKALNGNSTPRFFPLRGVRNSNLSPFFQEVYALTDTSVQSRGISSVFHEIVGTLSTRIQKILFESGDSQNLVKDIDSWQREVVSGRSSAFYGEFAENFSLAQTTQFMADILHQCGIANDLALVCLGERRNGILNEMGASWGKLYQGSVDADEVNIAVPKDGDVITMSVPGSYLLPLLSKGRKIVSSDGTSAYFPFYFSGATATWQGDNLISLSREDSPLDLTQNITLAFVSAGSLDTSIKEVQTALGIAPSVMPQLDRHAKVLDIYASYLKNQKGTPIKAPRLSR